MESIEILKYNKMKDEFVKEVERMILLLKKQKEEIEE